MESHNPLNQMAIQAIGILETKGLIALVQGTDAMLKSANVEIVAPMKGVGSALVSATIRGDVASVKAAIESGAEAAAHHGEVVSAHVIARPHEDTMTLIPSGKPAAKPAAKSTSK
jgi:ethanolamine utilization protein EutM